ncbi:unnamed protein product [Polarella glacialis]|uniref:Uncharacterized protein n=1 Tax=Polarella glacialis TaxID=89957 RepID=A0A813FWZ7_POLGL|nr:unnamed protein product [Polarella glacialis]
MLKSPFTYQSHVSQTKCEASLPHGLATTKRPRMHVFSLSSCILAEWKPEAYEDAVVAADLTKLGNCVLLPLRCNPRYQLQSLAGYRDSKILSRASLHCET